jgi:hypothetical protein
MQSKHSVFAYVSALFINFFPLPGSGQWLLVKEDSNFKVYLHEDWKENQTYRAEGIFHVSTDSLYRFLIDYSRYPSWVNFCIRTELIDSQQDAYYVYYALYDLPWPLADREAVSKIEISKYAGGKIEVNTSPANTKYESNTRARYVKNYHEKFTLTTLSEKKVLFTMQGSYHPEGYFPDWVIRKFLTEGPYDVLKKIKMEIE